MTLLRLVLMAALASMLVGCGSNPERQKARADAELTKEKTKTMQEYKSCLKKAKDDQQKIDACERLLKAIQPES